MTTLLAENANKLETLVTKARITMENGIRLNFKKINEKQHI